MRQTGMQTGKLRQLNAWLCPRLHDIMRECFTRDLWEMRLSTSYPGSFFGEGKTLVGAGHVTLTKLIA